MNEKLLIPVSIMVAGFAIGAAVWFKPSAQPQPVAANIPAQEENLAAPLKTVDAVSDHIVGNPNADIFVVEYSDLECPFCKRYHDTALPRLKSEYGDNERVAFVFRHFPLDEPFTGPLHPSATEQHVAAECVARLSNDETFFEFTDRIFASTNSDGQYPLDTLPDLAEEVGVDRTDFQTCYENQDTFDVVAAAFAEGQAAGVQGTPSIFLQTKDGESIQAVPDYNAIKSGIDAYLLDEA